MQAARQKPTRNPLTPGPFWPFTGACRGAGADALKDVKCGS